MTQKLSCYSIKVNPIKEELLREYLLPGSVLDVGCGNGLYGLGIVFRGFTVLQLDIADRRDPRARHLPFVQMDAQRLELIDTFFDNVIAFDIMEHLDNDTLFLRELRRVCQGRVILSVPNADDQQLREISLTHIHHTDKTHRREYTKEHLQEILEEAGFRVLEIRPHYNQCLINFASALAVDKLLAKLFARTIDWQCRLYEKIGFFQNRCPADWFAIAE